MRILRSAGHRQMPWKNGKGVTTEIAVFPEGASVDSFDWRISMANVPDSGPFSAFPGVDRVLAVLEGEMVLGVDGRPPETLGPLSPAIAFPGDTPTSAVVLREVTDLNVMVRRGKFTARVRKVVDASIKGNAAQTFVVLRSDAKLTSGETLGLDDVLHLGGSETATFKDVPVNAWLIEINRLPA
ncbi:HutD family protein [uncultured Phyllobacterium sp.]|uniref:HutD/Ves family protein n=1 Tax=uncultured Phyllobacterium sp. TaxID=253813 RepID=UPI00258CDF70|nr:HutD family protein [uncultured Phyllobacterium sp.]